MGIRLSFVIGIATLSLFTGLAQRAIEDGNLVITYQPWSPIALILAGLLAIPAGIVICLQKSRIVGVLIVIGGILAALAIAPGMCDSRVVVNERGFYASHGFWWDKIPHKIDYAELALVQVTAEVTKDQLGVTHYSYYFDCTFKTRPLDRVPLGDLVREALPDIIRQLRRQNVPIEVSRDLLIFADIKAVKP